MQSTTINVQFADESAEVIVSFFGAPQDPSAYSNLGTVEPTDPRWHAYYSSMPVEMREFLPTPI